MAVLGFEIPFFSNLLGGAGRGSSTSLALWGFPKNAEGLAGNNDLFVRVDHQHRDGRIGRGEDSTRSPLVDRHHLVRQSN